MACAKKEQEGWGCMKKICAKLCVIVVGIILSISLSDLEVSAFTQSDIQGRLQNLMSQYSGKTATSNQMYKGSQCKGFANWVFKELFYVYIGAYPESANYKIINANAEEIGVIEPGNLTESSAKKLLLQGMPGDYIQVQRSTERGRGPHSMILVSAKDSGIEVFDCNSDNRNTIKTYTISYHEFDMANRAMSLYRAHDYSYQPSSPPYNPSIEISSNYYSLNDVVKIIAKAEGGVDYNSIQIWEGSELLLTRHFTGESFTIPCSELGAGQYACYVVNVNSKGTATSSVVNFRIAEKLSNPQIVLEKDKLGLEDYLSVKAAADGGVDYYTIQVWRGSELLHTESFTGHSYSIPYSQFGAGQYACYIACTNASGTIFTPTVNFVIGDLGNQKIQLINDRLDIDDTLEVLASADGGVDYYTIQIWEGSELLHTESFTGHSFSISCRQFGIGEYACYVACTNGAGTVLTSTVPFTIAEKIVNPSIALSKDNASLQENINVSVSSEQGGEWNMIEIFNEKNEKIFMDTFSSDEYSLEGNLLGVGEYSLKVSVCNSVYKEALQAMKISISDSGNESGAQPHIHSYIAKVLKNATCEEEGIRIFICSECEAEYEETILKEEHVYEKKVTREATCSNPGEVSYVCAICKDVKTEIVPATNEHNYGEWETVNEPTCTERGRKNRVCSVCHQTDIAFIEKRPHVPGPAATCTEPQICTECESVLKDAAGHLSTKSIITAATFVKEGKREIVCTNCGMILKSDSIPKEKCMKGRNYIVGNYKYKITSAKVNGKGTVAFVGITKKISDVTVRDTVKICGAKFQVTSVANNALKNKACVHTVTIGKNVKSIGKRAFFGNKNLKLIKIHSARLKKVGASALKNIHAKAKIKVPKSKLKRYKALFRNKGQRRTVKIY